MVRRNKRSQGSSEVNSLGSGNKGGSRKKAGELTRIVPEMKSRGEKVSASDVNYSTVKDKRPNLTNHSEWVGEKGGEQIVEFKKGENRRLPGPKA